MIVAIDGPAGSGKSTVAKLVARTLGFHYLDTGAMYRCIAWYALEHGIDLSDGTELERVAREMPIVFSHEDATPVATGVSIAGIDVTREIRTPRIDKAVSPVSALAEVRSALVEQQRSIAKTDNVVMEGRDIGTVVFPDAEVKVYLTASAEERAHRRALQNAERGQKDVDEAAIYKAIVARDAADSSREVSPLKPAADAHIIDTTNMSIDEVCETIASLAKGQE